MYFHVASQLHELMTLELAIESQKSAQVVGALDTMKICQITQEATTNILISLFTRISYASDLRPTAVSLGSSASRSPHR